MFFPETKTTFQFAWKTNHSIFRWMWYRITSQCGSIKSMPVCWMMAQTIRGTGGRGVAHHQQPLKRLVKMTTDRQRIVPYAVNLHKHIFVMSFRLVSMVMWITIISCVLVSAECGIPNTTKRIVGGYETQVNEYPWLGLILNGQQVHCGSSLISDRYALTAAHCLQEFNVSQFTITFLEHRRSDTNETMRIVTRVIIKASVYVMMLKDFIRTNIQGQGLHDSS